MKHFLPALLVLLVLAAISLAIGASDLSIGALLSPRENEQAVQIMLVSRIPRTVALILAGTAMAVAGMIMQMLTQNRFVDRPRRARSNPRASACSS